MTQNCFLQQPEYKKLSIAFWRGVEYGRMFPIGPVKKTTRQKEVEDLVCEYFKTNMDMITEKTSKRDRVYPRQVLSYLLLEIGGMNSSEIGRLLFQDHTTVLTSRKKIGDLMCFDPAVKQDIDNLLAKLD